MIYICCDMNCNSHGNFFAIVAHEREVIEDETGYNFDRAHYPKSHCYRCKPRHPIERTFRYSEAIDILLPNEFIRWIKTRFGFSAFIERAIAELKFKDRRKRTKTLKPY